MDERRRVPVEGHEPAGRAVPTGAAAEPLAVFTPVAAVEFPGHVRGHCPPRRAGQAQAGHDRRQVHAPDGVGHARIAADDLEVLAVEDDADPVGPAGLRRHVVEHLPGGPAGGRHGNGRVEHPPHRLGRGKLGADQAVIYLYERPARLSETAAGHGHQWAW